MNEYEIEVRAFSNEEVVERIIKLTEGLTNFWSSAYGWAPVKAAELMSKSRLDWQASLARTLRLFLRTDNQTEEGTLILAWTTLGSLTEGTLKLFLSVWKNDYESSVFEKELHRYKDSSGTLIEPDGLMLEKLRVFFEREVYPKSKRDIWDAEGMLNIIEWIRKIQQRRNAIHAFKHREIGDFNDFFDEVKNYLIFMRRLTGGFPYPDFEEFYVPSEY